MQCTHFSNVLLWCIIFLTTKSVQRQLCDLSNNHSIYLHSGENGNFTSYLKEYYPSCGFEIVTSPFCNIKLIVDATEICNSSENGNNNYECSCGKVVIKETSNEEMPNVLCLSNNITEYSSTSRSIILLYDFPYNLTGKFFIRYESQKNQKFVNGTIGDSGFITTPNFPSLYPRDYGTEHKLICESEDCVISVLFSDFLISSSSIIEFFDSDDKLIDLVSGLKSRPPLILSTGKSLTIRFFGNGGSSLGYKANYRFQNDSAQWPNTECGGEIHDLGGSIFMDNVEGYYDCFWIIKPAPSISYLKSHIYLKVLNFTGRGEIYIHRDITSEGNIIGKITHDINRQNEYVTSISRGFYVSLKGVFSTSSNLIIAYSAFSTKRCLSGMDFLCNNNRCIIQPLVCDSIDNCGDNSDEAAECSNSETFHRYWWPLRNGGDDEYVEGKVFGGLWMCVMVFISIIFILTVTLCKRTIRIHPLNNNQSSGYTNNDQIQTITQLLTVEEIEEPDEPPVYEPPPDYNQIVKPVNQKRRKKQSRSGNKTNVSSASENTPPYVSLQLENLDNKLRADSNIMIPEGISETSLPASLETAGYNEQELGLSLTLSTTTEREDFQPGCFTWMPKPLQRTVADSVPSCSMSASSFDTLHSSQERVIDTLSRAIVRCHSHEHIPTVYDDLNTNITYTYNRF